MFKNLIVYRLPPGWQFPALVDLPVFTTCAPTQSHSARIAQLRGVLTRQINQRQQQAQEAETT